MKYPRWNAIEPVTQGHAAVGGTPTNGTNGTTTRAEHTAISAMAVNGSSLIFRKAFQPAWQAAPNSTAKKT
jgi:hypothetical protein